MSFQDIVGQKSAIRILQDELIQGRISHAYLFIGRDGVGKKTLAFQFAKALNCHNSDDDSCERCLSCKKINHFNHPDVKLIGIEEGNSLKIEQIRELQREIVYKPYESAWKIYIIDQADQMTIEAANSLLKTLEEPPQYAIIILLAEEINRLLPTIISRCQQIYLNTISWEILKTKLMENGLDEKKALLFAHLAEGSLGKAIILSQNEDFLSARKNILDLLSKLPKLDTVEIFNQAKYMVDLLDRDFPLFDLILSWYRDIIIYNQGNKDDLINFDYLEGIKSQIKIYTIEELISITSLISIIKRYIKQNVKKDLALEVMLFKIRARRI